MSDIVEQLAEILMLRDVAPFPRVWSGEQREGKEIDNRGVEWTTITPVCSEKERQKWRREALRFLHQLRAARMQVMTRNQAEVSAMADGEIPDLMEPYVPCLIWFREMDAMEYIQADTLYVAHEIDAHLTLFLDPEDRTKVIGARLTGVRAALAGSTARGEEEAK